MGLILVKRRNRLIIKPVFRKCPSLASVAAQEGDPSNTISALWVTRTQNRARLKIPAKIHLFIANSIFKAISSQTDQQEV